MRPSAIWRGRQSAGAALQREFDRRLLFAFAVSLVAHLVLLGGAYPALPVRMVAAAKPIEAVIKSPSQVIPRAAAAPVPEIVATQRPAEITTLGNGWVVPRQNPASEVRPRVAPSLAGRAALRKSGHGWTSPLVAEVPVGAAAAAVHDAASPDDLRDYRLALAIAARRFKRYPPVARESGWQGAVEVSVSVTAGRRTPELSLVKSSGYAVLDAQAILMIEQAAVAATLPDSLQGRNFRVLLPIEFSLDPRH